MLITIEPNPERHRERRAVVRTIVKPILCGTDPFLETLFLFHHSLLYLPNKLSMRQDPPTTTTIHFCVRTVRQLRMCRQGQSYLNDAPPAVVGTVFFHVLAFSCPISVRHRIHFLTTTTTSTISREQLRKIPYKIQSVVQISNLLRLVFSWFQQRGKSRRKETSLTRR